MEHLNAMVKMSNYINMERMMTCLFLSSVSGSMGPTATLASLLSDNHIVIPFIARLRCNLNFLLLRTANMCIRGSRSTSFTEECSLSDTIA